MIVVRVDDQDVLVSIVVEIRNDRHARLAVRTIGSFQHDAGTSSHVGKVPLAVIDQERISCSADEQQIHIGITVEILRRDAASGEGGLGDDALVTKLAQPTGRAMDEVKLGGFGRVGEKARRCGV